MTSPAVETHTVESHQDEITHLPEILVVVEVLRVEVTRTEELHQGTEDLHKEITIHTETLVDQVDCPKADLVGQTVEDQMDLRQAEVVPRLVDLVVLVLHESRQAFQDLQGDLPKEVLPLRGDLHRGRIEEEIGKASVLEVEGLLRLTAEGHQSKEQDPVDLHEEVGLHSGVKRIMTFIHLMHY